MTVRKECVLEFLEQGGAFIVDAREDHEYSVSHFKVAIHIPASDAYNQVGKLMEAGAQVNDPIIVYCGGGDCEASHNVATALRENDFQRVYIYENGWKEVEASGEFGAFVEMGSAN
jgi:rhodanese-related sulfurtransferase